MDLDTSPRQAGRFAPFPILLASAFDSGTGHPLIPWTESAGAAELGRRGWLYRQPG